MKGVAWDELREAARGYLGRPDLSGLNSNHDVRTLAAALMFARTGQETYRSKDSWRDSCCVMESEIGASTLALARNLVSYVIAADLVNLPAYDASIDGDPSEPGSAACAPSASATARSCPRRTSDPTTGARTPPRAGSPSISISAIREDLTRAAAVFRSYLGETSRRRRSVSAAISRGRRIRTIPAASTPSGRSRHGNLARRRPARGDAPRGEPGSPPSRTGYPWEALQGSLVAATLLGRAGFDAWNWGDQAIRRAVGFLERLDSHWGGWWATGDDSWQLFLVNRAYGTRFATDPYATLGKNMGWTAWDPLGAIADPGRVARAEPARRERSRIRLRLALTIP